MLIQNWFYKIPDGWRICGENLQARHSIGYCFNDINEMFQTFGIYDDENICLSWNDTVSICLDFGISIVPEIYRGKYDKDKILEAFERYKQSVEPQEVEGFVIRNAESFPYEKFKENTGKYVRANHVQTDEHWTKNWSNNEVKKK